MDKVCFIVMGFGEKTNPTNGKTYNLDKTYDAIIRPAVEKAGYKCEICGTEINLKQI